MREKKIINKTQSQTPIYADIEQLNIKRRRRRKIEDTAKQREKFDKILKSFFFATTTIGAAKLASQTLTFAHKVMREKKKFEMCQTEDSVC